MLSLTRFEQLQRLRIGIHDVLVVGGGINGAVSAAALAARGMKVALIEAGDFAGETSSSSSCMVWGGIKYLQSAEIRLVRNLCKARNTLMQSYPTQVPEARYTVALDREAPHHPFSILAGSWLYWLIGDGFTRMPGRWSPRVLRDREPALVPGTMRGGVAYSDAWLPEGDAHFVFGFIQRAWGHGACAVNYVRASGGGFRNGIHHTEVTDTASGETFTIRSRAMVNACGPWAGQFNHAQGIETRNHLVLSKGIHLVVPQVTDSGRILTFFAADDRPFFVLPMGDRSCIGTTDTRVTSPETTVTDEDRDFVLQNLNRYLKTSLRREDIISERCGVRPLVVEEDPSDNTDWTQLSRKHVLESNLERRYLTIFGGKLTDCLNIGNEVCETFREMGLSGSRSNTRWFGEPGRNSRRRFLERLHRFAPGIDGPSLWRRHGRDTSLLLERLEGRPAEARELLPGTGILECEVHCAASHHMIVKLEDYFRRRTLLEMTRGRSFLRTSESARAICDILFGPSSDQRWNEYLKG